MKMSDKLFMKMETKSPFHDDYMYMDAEPYVAPQIFARLKLRIHVYDLYSGSMTIYKCVICRVRKKDAPKFEQAIEELAKNMILTGHPHYAKEAADFISKIKVERM